MIIIPVKESRGSKQQQIESVDGSSLVYPSEWYMVIDILINRGLFNSEGRFLKLNESD